MYTLKSYFLLITAMLSISVTVVAQSNNQIEGRVVTEQNAPVNNAYVELYNDLDFLISRTRSSSQGRFTFRGLRAGQYIVRIKPYGTNLMEEMERVEIRDFGTLPDIEYVDVKLKVDERFNEPTEIIVGTIFAQEIPNEAKQLFAAGTKKLKSANNKEGFADIEAAIKVFPDYFDALNLLGINYIKQGKYEQGYPFLLRAIDVNPRCPECFYSLGVAFYKLNQIEAGIKASKAAVVLKPDSGDAHLLLGILFRISNDLDEAEKSLTTAKKLYKTPNPEVYWQLSLLYNKTNRNKEAADELEKYLKAKPDLSANEKKSLSSLIEKLRKSQ